MSDPAPGPAPGSGPGSDSGPGPGSGSGPGPGPGPGAEDAPERPGLGDLVGGALAAVLGVAIVLYARGFPSLPGGAPGPALFPSIIGVLLAVFGLILVVRWLRYWRGAVPEPDAEVGAERDAEVGAAPEAGGGPPSRTALVNAAAVLGSVVLYLLLADLLGFAVTMCLLLFGLMWRLGTRPLVAAASAIATTALIYVLFQVVLLVPLPLGPFG